MYCNKIVLKMLYITDTGVKCNQANIGIVIKLEKFPYNCFAYNPLHSIN